MRPLEHKVALLIDTNGKCDRSLVLTLAECGATIAVVVDPRHVETARETRRRVEGLGRHALIIPDEPLNAAFAHEVVRRTVSEFGQIDVFIDCSTWIRGRFDPNNHTEQTGRTLGSDRVKSFTGIDIMAAAINHMVTASPTYQNRPAESENGQTTKEMNMRVAQELINKPVISIEEGEELGTVQDFYLDRELLHLAAIFLGREGLLSRTESLVLWDGVVTFGQDAILVEDAQHVMELSEVEDTSFLIRRDEVIGRPVATPGGTKIGMIGDIIVDEKALIAGFTLPQVYVSGPIATSRAISRSAVSDSGQNDGIITVNLANAEQTTLQVEYEGLFAKPSVSSTE